jgi:hypothetical protein
VRVQWPTILPRQDAADPGARRMRRGPQARRSRVTRHPPCHSRST